MRGVAAGTSCFVSWKLSLSRWGKDPCEWNEEKRLTVRSWRLVANFTWRTKAVASASFCKFPMVIHSSKLHFESFFFFFGRGFNRAAFFKNTNLFRSQMAQWTTVTTKHRSVEVFPCVFADLLVWSWRQKGFGISYPPWSAVQCVSRKMLLQVVRCLILGSLLHANCSHTLLHRQPSVLCPSGCMLNCCK